MLVCRAAEAGVELKVRQLRQDSATIVLQGQHLSSSQKDISSSSYLLQMWRASWL
jgi:hypothetical protein